LGLCSLKSMEIYYLGCKKSILADTGARRYE
jgi:hypothetical protein